MTPMIPKTVLLPGGSVEHGSGDVLDDLRLLHDALPVLELQDRHIHDLKEVARLVSANLRAGGDPAKAAEMLLQAACHDGSTTAYDALRAKHRTPTIING